MAGKSQLEERLALQLRARPHIPEAKREFRFARHLRGPSGRPRMWRFDFAWPEIKLACEVQGAVWTGGKHGRGSGLVKDYQKANAAAMLGWRVVYADASMVRSCEIIETLEKILCPRGTAYARP